MKKHSNPKRDEIPLGLETVSYTHLDVYKRQVLGLSLSRRDALENLREHGLCG